MMRIAFSFMLAAAGLVSAQGTKVEYDRATNLFGKIQGKVFRDKIQPVWISNGLWYRVQTGKDQFEHWLVDADSGNSESLFDEGRLSAALKEIGVGNFKFDQLALPQITISEDRSKLRFPLKGETVTWNRRDHSLDLTDKGNPPKAEAKPETKQSRRGKDAANPWRAYKEDDKLMLESRDGKEKYELACDGKDYHFAGPYLFSPDFQKLVVQRVLPGEKHDIPMVESSPKTQVQPKLRTNPNYWKPGDRITISKPRLFDLETKKEIAIDEKLFDNPYDIRDVRWVGDSSRFTFEFNQRGHQVYRVLAVDAKTGTVKAIVGEEPKTFFDYANKHFIHWCTARAELIWMSERSGWNHLYLFDSKDGRLVNPITQGEWVVRKVDFVDEDKGQIWLDVGGIDPKQDPYYIHCIRVNFDGTGLIRLTEGNGTHKVVYSPDRKLLVDTYTRVDMPPIHELRDGETGKLIAALQKSDDSDLKKAGWLPPEQFVAKARDGKTDIYGLIYRPTNFDPAKKYPVIEYIYAGPHGSFVPKAFQSTERVALYAELGFIVVKIDGMGTSNRSKAFHDVCWKNLGDAGFPDRILWMKGAAAKHPEMDLTRVGIYGGSAGGQNAMRALIAHGDFYKAAASDCGCHDNRMDKIWWNELWMSWPVDKHYEEASNVVQAHKMQGKLLLTVGELDRNVDPSSTMQVVNALIKANKDFELIVVPGADHGAGESPYMNRRRMDFFVRNLMEVEPRAK